LNNNSLAGFVETIEITKIRPSDRQLRNFLGEIEGLQLSIKQNGLLEPIVVRPASSAYEVIAGNRRLEACARLGWHRIPCLVIQLDDKAAYEVSLTENVQRQTLLPIEEAWAFRKYVSEFGYGSESELARQIGKSQQYVSQRLKLLDLPSEVLEKVTTRVVNLAQARELVGLAAEDQILIAEMVSQEGMSSREVKRLAKRLKTPEDGSNDSGFFYSEALNYNNKFQHTEKLLTKCILSLKICLNRFDGLIDGVDEKDWILKELLMEHRKSLHYQIDVLLKEKSRIDAIMLHLL
jgi:ParB family transcriptional regulator, chromosome partitioning protein